MSPHHQLPLSLRYLRARLLPLTRPMVWMPLIGIGLVSLFLWEAISNPDQLASETFDIDAGPANTDLTTQLSEENRAIAVDIDNSTVLKSLLNSGNPGNPGQKNTSNNPKAPGNGTPQQSPTPQTNPANPVPSATLNPEINLSPYTGVGGLYGVLPSSGESMLPPVSNAASGNLSNNLLLNPMQSQTSAASDNTLKAALEQYAASDRTTNPSVTTEPQKSETAAIAPTPSATVPNQPERPIAPQEIQAMPTIPGQLPPPEIDLSTPTAGQIPPQSPDANAQNAYTYLRDTQAAPMVSPPIEQVPAIVTPSISNPNSLDSSQLTPKPFGYPYNEATPNSVPGSSLNRPGYISNNANDLNLPPYSSNLGTQVSSPSYAPDMGTQVYSPVYPNNGASVGGIQTYDPAEEAFSVPNNIPGQYIGGGEIRTFSNP